MILAVNEDKKRPKEIYRVESRMTSRFDVPFLERAAQIDNTLQIHQDRDIEESTHQEDDFRTRQWFITFDAKSIGDFGGKIILILEVPDHYQHDRKADFDTSNIRFSNVNGRLGVEGTFDDPSKLKYSWGFSLNPRIRKAPLVGPNFSSLLDADAIKDVFHLTSLSQNPKTVPGWENDANGISGEEVLLKFPKIFVPQIEKIETAEHILNELDERFSFNCQFLVWDANKIKIVDLSDVTSEYKNLSLIHI